MFDVKNYFFPNSLLLLLNKNVSKNSHNVDSTYILLKLLCYFVIFTEDFSKRFSFASFFFFLIPKCCMTLAWCWYSFKLVKFFWLPGWMSEWMNGWLFVWLVGCLVDWEFSFVVYFWDLLLLMFSFLLLLPSIVCLLVKLSHSYVHLL